MFCFYVIQTSTDYSRASLQPNMKNFGKCNCSSSYNILPTSMDIQNTNGRPHNSFSNNKHKNEDKLDKQQDLFKSLKGYLIVGKFLGVLPISGVFGKSWKDLCFKKKSVSFLVTFGITAILFFNSVLGILESIRVEKRDALQLAKSISYGLSFTWAWAIYVIFLFRANTFLKIFEAWGSSRITFGQEDSTLYRDSLLLTVGILISAILENAVLHLEYFKSLDFFNGERYNGHHNNMTEFEAFYHRSLPHWSKVMNYNWFFALVGFIQHKWGLYAWNYVDISLAVFGRAMYFRFKSLLEEAENRLLGPMELKLRGQERAISNDHNAWLQVAKDHEILCGLVEILENFFSPIVFASYLINLFYISLQVLGTLTDEAAKYSFVHSIYGPWSFLHLIFRTFAVSLCCARINVYAHKLLNILQECPIQFYTPEISRVYTRVVTGPDIGLTGFGCFTVTKPFILSLLSVIFTFEVVLLQCVSDQSTPVKNC